MVLETVPRCILFDFLTQFLQQNLCGILTWNPEAAPTSELRELRMI